MRRLLVIFVILFQIVFSKIKCVNYYGFETERMGLVCDWKHPFTWYMDHLQSEMGINTIRLPFSYEYVKYHDTGYMSSFIEESNKRNINIILDWHRTWNTHQGAVPEEGISRDEFIEMWIVLLARYPTIYGIGVFNEIQHNDFEYTNQLHRDVITTIEDHFPDTYYYFVGCPSWGNDCSSIDLSDMPTWNRTFVEVHEYMFSYNSNKEGWDFYIPYSIESDHWFVGEVGWRDEIKEEHDWAEQFLSYLQERNITNLCLWTIANSHDTGGLWKNDCETFESNKASMIKSFWD